MKQLSYTLKTGNALNRWLKLGVFETKKTFSAATMEGDINDWLVKGYGIHEFPGRKEFIEQRETSKFFLAGDNEIYPGLTQVYQGESKKWELHMPFENPTVESEGFWDTPTHIEGWAYTELVSDEEQQVTFKLSTCGGVILWVNGELVSSFSPFTRNKLASTDIKLTLKKGMNRLALYYDDLAERDTKFAFRLDFKEGLDVTTVIPIGEQEPAVIYQLEDLLYHAYFPVDSFTSGEVQFMFDKATDQEFTLYCRHQVERCPKKLSTYQISVGDTFVNLGDVHSFQMGYTSVEMTIDLGDIHLSRYYGMEIYPIEFQELNAGTMAERKKMSLEVTAKHGEPNIHKILALLNTTETLTDFEKSNLMNVLYYEMNAINNRYDCSDFSVIMFFRLIRDFSSSAIFTKGLMEQLESMILHYRYWMDEPGNDVMWFFSENHALIFHSSELLAGQLYPNDIFPNANITGKEHYLLAEQRLHNWFDRFFREGLAEWNSAPYIPINVIGLISLYDFAESNDIRNKAKKALDQIFYWLAINSYNGFLTGSQGRVYEKELKGNYNTQTSHLAWIAWGKGAVNYATFGSVALALSDYNPPSKYLKYLEFRPGTSLSYANQQGPDGYAQLYTYKQDRLMLSSALNFKPGEKGYQEHLLQASFGPEANVWINHPGEMVIQGKGRPSYWAGNGFLPKVWQYQKLAIAAFTIDANHDVDFTHAYVPLFAFDEYDQKGNWLFLRKDVSFLAIYASNGLELVTKGANKQREFISTGRNSVWLIRLSSTIEYNSFELFKRDILSSQLEINVNKLTGSFNDPEFGIVTFGENQSLLINDVVVNVADQTVIGTLCYNEKGN